MIALNGPVSAVTLRLTPQKFQLRNLLVMGHVLSSTQTIEIPKPLGNEGVMSSYRIEVSDHAHDRLKQRKITREQARLTIIRGNLIGLDIRGRQISSRSFGSRVLVVVYLVIPSGYLLVTAYWR